MPAASAISATNTTPPGSIDLIDGVLQPILRVRHEALAVRSLEDRDGALAGPDDAGDERVADRQRPADPAVRGRASRRTASARPGSRTDRGGCRRRSRTAGCDAHARADGDGLLRHGRSARSPRRVRDDRRLASSLLSSRRRRGDVLLEHERRGDARHAARCPCRRAWCCVLMCRSTTDISRDMVAMRSKNRPRSW